jgi:hypothetical protein
MPSAQAAAVILFWVQIVCGIAAAIVIGQWMWAHAKRIREGDMTSFPMRHPRLLLGLMALSLFCGVFGLWTMFHLPKPSPCPAPAAATTTGAPDISTDKVVTWPAPQTQKEKDADQLEAKKLVLEYRAKHPGQVDEKAELDWVNQHLASEGIPFTLTSVQITRVPQGQSNPPNASHPGGAGIIGGRYNDFDDVHVNGFGTGIDLSHADTSIVKHSTATAPGATPPAPAPADTEGKQ